VAVAVQTNCITNAIKPDESKRIVRKIKDSRIRGCRAFCSVAFAILGGVFLTNKRGSDTLDKCENKKKIK